MERFEIVSGQARLAAEWRAVSADGTVLVTRSSTFSEPVSGTGYANKISALSAALGELSKEISDTIGEMIGSPSS